MKTAALLLLACAVLVSPVRAEPIPETVLDHDYASCMGEVTAQQDPRRGAYCACVRDRMRRWDLDTYGNIAMEQLRSGNSQPPQKVRELAQECMAQIPP